MSDDPIEIPPDVSPVRFMLDSAHGRPHRRFASLAEARAHADAALVMEGDFGGQIYLTCPLRLVQCDQPALAQLLEDLNHFAGFEGEGLFFELLPVGSGVAGGMGGGAVAAEVWLHDEFIASGLYDGVRDVIDGKAPDLLSAIGPNTVLPTGCTFFQAALKEWGDALPLRCLAAGADAAAPDPEGYRPLHRAAEGGMSSVVRRLIEMQVELDPRAGLGDWTPLHLAAHMGQIESVRALVDAGADLNAKNRSGRTPHGEACFGNGPSNEVAVFIQEAERRATKPRC